MLCVDADAAGPMALPVARAHVATAIGQFATLSVGGWRPAVDVWCNAVARGAVEGRRALRGAAESRES